MVDLEDPFSYRWNTAEAVDMSEQLEQERKRPTDGHAVYHNFRCLSITFLYKSAVSRLSYSDAALMTGRALDHDASFGEKLDTDLH